MTKPGSKDTKAGPLAGNSGILSLSSSVSSAYSSGFKITSTNTVYSWSQLGLEWNRNGSVTIREGDLSTAIDGDIGTAMLGGFTSTIKATLAQFRGVSGSLQSSIDVLQTNRSRLSTNIDDLQSRLEKTRAKLISKYASLDAKLVSMNQMSANVRSSLAGLQ
jgi:flagellar capping protein FliD